jgi:hypothetical protein
LPTRAIACKSDDASLNEKMALRVSPDKTAMVFKKVGAARPRMIF